MNTVTRIHWLATALWFALATGGRAAAPAERWVYYPTNLLVDKNVDTLEAVFRRAANAGYTHVNVCDSKFCRLHEMPPPYFRNVERVRKLAAELKLELIPGVFPIGWSNDLLHNDPNLAEGVPVRDALFVVRGGEGRLVSDPPVELPGGSMSDLAEWSWHDKTVVAVEGAARIANVRGENARIVQTVNVSPFRQYHVSLRIKTRGFRGTPEVKVLANGRALNYNDLGVKRTQDWTEHHTVFNSLENREVGVYIGCWGGGDGELWLDDVKLEEVGLLNVLRRPGAPLAVRRDEPGAAPLVEGRDFEHVADPRMGSVPYAGEYEVWHAPPAIRIKLPDGTRLRVSYFHPMIIYGGSVMIALSEPKTLELLADHARRVHAAWHAPGYFMQHDEIRLLNWDDVSQRRAMTAGQILADNLRVCTRMLREANPGGGIYAWSDMFDPHHNAVDNYYLVRGTLAGSWEGLDRDVIVVNWNFDKRDKSLDWFARRGHKQLLAGYYDGPVENAGRWLDSAQRAGGAAGIMYTTWQNNYADLEAFSRAIDKHAGAAADGERRPRPPAKR